MSEKDLSYKTYLDLDTLLRSQKPLSAAHDEMMFVVLHQTYELWFKLILFELDRVQKVFGNDVVRDADLRIVSASLSRVTDILRLLVRQLDIMETMTPLDFLDFRHVFRTASGFQSMQFRQIEIRLGLQHGERVGYDGKSYEHFLSAEDRDALHEIMKAPSLVDQVGSWLGRTPFVEMTGFSFWQSYRRAVADMIEGDRRAILANGQIPENARETELTKLKGMQAQFDLLFADGEGETLPWRFTKPALQAALFINLYRDQPALQIPFKILSDLMDVDELMALWRYRHALMAQRMLGTKMGSGGSTGHDYLAATATKHRTFRDLFALSTFLIPRSKLPRLPSHVEARMGFKYWDET
ncbi:MAG TPA: tryptophan 2,3-dioxygenase family protein [Patescibacteria group bacterium]|nr:tryptophan 2,3-dioxygenase family protein [Patescibacteria group bacterium]